MPSIPANLETWAHPRNPMLGAVMMERSPETSVSKADYLHLIESRVAHEMQDQDDPDEAAERLGKKLEAAGLLEESPIGLPAAEAVRLLFQSQLLRQAISAALNLGKAVSVKNQPEAKRLLEESDPFAWADALITKAGAD